MPRRIRWTRRAARRLDQIGASITKESPKGAARVIRRLVSAIEPLTRHPALGRIGRIEGTRELVLADTPYIIAYRVTTDTVDILTVMHTSQQWPDEL
jgi:addiction module RelE/StbE family toxin